jgi:hypothetical protein
MRRQQSLDSVQLGAPHEPEGALREGGEGREREGGRKGEGTQSLGGRIGLGETRTPESGIRARRLSSHSCVAGSPAAAVTAALRHASFLKASNVPILTRPFQAAFKFLRPHNVHCTWSARFGAMHVQMTRVGPAMIPGPSLSSVTPVPGSFARAGPL